MSSDRHTAHTQASRAGVLLINLGTPEAPTPSAIRRYLREFLSDDRVVDVEPALWWPLLNGIILNTRPRKLAAKYRSIWTREGGPLVAIGRKQALGVAERLSSHFGEPVPVALAMRYGAPSVEAGIAELEHQGVRRIVALPLFPQYSASTTAAAMDAVFAALSRRRFMPELRSQHAYHDHPAYIEALAQSVEQHWARHGRGEHLLLSFHGIPQRYFDLGDPYFCHCQKTARLLRERLGLSGEQCSLSFQSRFGREEWLKPYTDQQLDALSGRGIRTLDVLAPGFAADCLETLEEIAVEYRGHFTASGGTLRYIEALNDRPAHLDALAQMATAALTGWLPAAETMVARQARVAALSGPESA